MKKYILTTLSLLNDLLSIKKDLVSEEGKTILSDPIKKKRF